MAAAVMEKGYNVFSPITHTHPIASFSKLEHQDHDFWLKADEWFLERCDEVWILLVPGWMGSKGVRQEIVWAIQKNIPIHGINTNGVVTEGVIHNEENYIFKSNG